MSRPVWSCFFVARPRWPHLPWERSWQAVLDILGHIVVENPTRHHGLRSPRMGCSTTTSSPSHRPKLRSRSPNTRTAPTTAPTGSPEHAVLCVVSGRWSSTVSTWPFRTAREAATGRSVPGVSRCSTAGRPIRCWPIAGGWVDGLRAISEQIVSESPQILVQFLLVEKPSLRRVEPFVRRRVPRDHVVESFAHHVPVGRIRGDASVFYPGKSPHLVGQARGVHDHERKVSIEVVRKRLGHAPTETTQVYTQRSTLSRSPSKAGSPRPVTNQHRGRIHP